MVDYMLYFVIMRSESPQRMQYKHLIELLDSLIASKSSLSGASQTNTAKAPQNDP